MSQPPIKVLLVEDSPVALNILQRLLKSCPEIAVVGTASNGKEALGLIPKLNPEVICTDLTMKGMDGLELTQQVMAKYPRPILVISNSVQKYDTKNVFKLLQAGALDVFPKPKTGLESDYGKVKEQLLDKIKVISGVSVFTKPLRQTVASSINTKLSSTQTVSTSQAIKKISEQEKGNTIAYLKATQDIAPFPVKVVAIGVSTGGPRALNQVISPLPKNFPVPIICTQHISPGFLEGLVNWLDRESKLRIKIAQKGEYPRPGTVYFAPENSHLQLTSQGQFIHTSTEAVDGHCPSATVMFQSVAKFYGRKSLGILLTGMGRDGATGMKAIAEIGGMTIAQDEKSCIVFGMPKAAIEIGAAKHILPLQEIAPLLTQIQQP